MMPQIKKQGHLYILVGIPRSGKSTISKQWENFQIDIGYGHQNSIYVRSKNNKSFEENPRIVVNSDKIRLALHTQPYIQESEEFIHAIKYLIIRTYLSMNYDVLVDGTHTTKLSIKPLLYIDNKLKYYIVDTPIEECQSRAIKDGQEYLITGSVIERMDKQLKEWKNNPEEFLNNIRNENSTNKTTN